LEQSISMIAATLCWELDDVFVEPTTPIIALKDVASETMKVKKGYVSGLRQKATGIKKFKDVITLNYQAYVGAKEEYDSIRIDGTPSINQRITPCIQGDLATVGIVVNAIPRLMNAAPGLITMKDLPVLSATLGDITKHVYTFTKTHK
jgi:hypothetical protein